MLAALIHMEHKYEMIAICASALDCMKTGFLEDLDMFLKVYADTDQMKSEDMTAEAEDAIIIIWFACLTQTDFMLSIAFYLCSQLNSRHLINGVIDSDRVTHDLFSYYEDSWSVKKWLQSMLQNKMKTRGHHSAV